MAASMSQVNIILRAQSEKKKKDWEEGREGERGLECLCVTQRAREKQTERRKRKREREIESGGCVLVSPPNQFSWGIYHQLQRRRQVGKAEEGDRSIRPGCNLPPSPNLSLAQVRNSFTSADLWMLV